MKRYLLSVILFLTTTVFAQEFSFSAVAPTGQTLFYQIQNDNKHPLAELNNKHIVDK